MRKRLAACEHISSTSDKKERASAMEISELQPFEGAALPHAARGRWTYLKHGAARKVKPIVWRTMHSIPTALTLSKGRLIWFSK